MGKKKKGGFIPSDGEKKAFDALMEFSPNMHRECIIQITNARDVKIQVIDFEYNDSKMLVEITGKLRMSPGKAMIRMGNSTPWKAVGNFDGVVISALKSPKTKIIKDGKPISYDSLYDYACKLPFIKGKAQC